MSASPGSASLRTSSNPIHLSSRPSQKPPGSRSWPLPNFISTLTAILRFSFLHRREPPISAPPAPTFSPRPIPNRRLAFFLWPASTKNFAAAAPKKPRIALSNPTSLSFNSLPRRSSPPPPAATNFDFPSQLKFHKNVAPKSSCSGRSLDRFFFLLSFFFFFFLLSFLLALGREEK